MDLSSAVRSAVKAAAADGARARFLKSCARGPVVAAPAPAATELGVSTGRADFLKSLAGQRCSSDAGQNKKRRISFGFKTLRTAVALSTFGCNKICWRGLQVFRLRSNAETQDQPQ